MEWRYILQEVTLGDLAIKNVEDLNARGLRTNEPHLLVCRLPSVGHSSVIVAAPLDHYLCGLRRYPVFDDAIWRYTGESLIRSDEIYRGVLKDIRGNGLTKDTFPSLLFLPYANWGTFTSKKHGPFGKAFRGSALDHRVTSWMVADSAVEGVIGYFERLLDDIGASAFVRAPETLNETVSAPGFSEIPSHSMVRYESRDYDAIAVNTFATSELLEQGMQRLRHLVARVRTEGAGVLDLFPLHHVKHAPSVYVRAGAPNDDPTWERALLRSELIGLLGFVWHYPAVRIQRERIHELMPSLGNASFTADEILRNLTKYLQEMEDKYPAIRVNPLVPRPNVP